jgi:hypothetical protein
MSANALRNPDSDDRSYPQKAAFFLDYPSRARKLFGRGLLFRSGIGIGRITMKTWTARWFLAASVVGLAVGSGSMTARGGSIFLSGHDPDFHAAQGLNGTGAQHIIQDSLTFARNGSTAPILLLETSTANISLGDHADSEAGLIASGYSAGTTAGNHYEKVSATQFATINLAQFSALFIPSDHGGTLTGDDLKALNARSSDIVNYLNAGGGLVAFAEDGNRTLAAIGPQPINYGFLPFVLNPSALSQSESGFTLTAAGTALGLVVSDINGNASHNIFGSSGGLTVVDRDASNNIVSLEFQGPIGVPAPPSLGMAAVAGVVGVSRWWLRRR